MKRGFVCGVFDLYHAGHVLMLQECKSQCDYLIVALNEARNIDKSINPNKIAPLFNIEERRMIMESCRFVDQVLVYNSEEELYKLIQDLKPEVRFLGDDYKGKKITGADLGIPIYYTDRSHGLSTSDYKKKLLKLMSPKSE